jgi:hypothetical protein
MIPSWQAASHTAEERLLYTVCCRGTLCWIKVCYICVQFPTPTLLTVLDIAHMSSSDTLYNLTHTHKPLGKLLKTRPSQAAQAQLT